jgi:hypothetical protein
MANLFEKYPGIHGTDCWNLKNCAKKVLPHLFFLEQTVDTLQDPEHWKTLCPFMGLPNASVDTETRPSFLDDAERNACLCESKYQILQADC